MTLRIERYKHTRHWALYDGADLVVVTVYRRGAREVQRRLAAQPRATAEAAAAAAAQAAAARQAQELAAQARALARQARAAARARAQPAGEAGAPPLAATPARWLLAFPLVRQGVRHSPLPYAGQASLQRQDRRRLAASPRPPCASQRGCWGLLPLTIRMLPGSLAEAEWHPSGDAVSAAAVTRSR